MTPASFIAKWSRVTLPERAASQEHFIDLCRLLGQPTPAEHDATGAEYTFEKGVSVIGGASKGSKGKSGFADVWWRNKFGWEYKRKDKYKDLDEAYRQLLQYREALENPPLLVVSDITRTQIHSATLRGVQPGDKPRTVPVGYNVGEWSVIERDHSERILAKLNAGQLVSPGLDPRKLEDALQQYQKDLAIWQATMQQYVKDIASSQPATQRYLASSQIALGSTPKGRYPYDFAIGSYLDARVGDLVASDTSLAKRLLEDREPVKPWQVTLVDKPDLRLLVSGGRGNVTLHGASNGWLQALYSVPGLGEPGFLGTWVEYSSIPTEMRYVDPESGIKGTSLDYATNDFNTWGMGSFDGKLALVVVAFGRKNYDSRVLDSVKIGVLQGDGRAIWRSFETKNVVGMASDGQHILVVYGTSRPTRFT